MSDEGIHEIQLNGKQLVFLFMTVTVVAVVIFLCGVMVGRGVRVPSGIEAAALNAAAAVDPTAEAQAASVVPTVDGAPTAAAETLTYAERLEDPRPAPERLEANSEARQRPEASTEPRQRIETSTEPRQRIETNTEPRQRLETKTAPREQTRPEAADPDPHPSAADTALPEPPGNGFVVQVAAVRARAEADVIARRLASKGYPSFVTTPGTGVAKVFRVRVGKYSDRREAETVATRLEKEEQFKPWITR